MSFSAFLKEMFFKKTTDSQRERERKRERERERKQVEKKKNQRPTIKRQLYLDAPSDEWMGVPHL